MNTTKVEKVKIAPHSLADGATSCSDHPGARIFSECGMTVCTSYVPPDASNARSLESTVPLPTDTKVQSEPSKVQSEPSKTDKSKHEKRKGEEQEEVVFPSPAEVIEIRARESRERASRQIHHIECDLRSAVKIMVLNGKDSCQKETFIYDDVRLSGADYDGIRVKLQQAGYNVTFTDKRTGLSPEFEPESQQQQQQQQPHPQEQQHHTCGCSSCNLDRDGESVLVELRRIRDAVSSWWFSGLDGASDKKKEDEETRKDKSFMLVSSISIRKPDDPFQKTPPGHDTQQQQQQQQHPRQQQQQQPPVSPRGDAIVMKTLMTCNILILLSVFSLAPAFVPHFVKPFWYVFVMFVLAARLVRWTTGVSSSSSPSPSVAQQPRLYHPTHCRNAAEVSAAVSSGATPTAYCGVYHYPPGRGE